MAFTEYSTTPANNNAAPPNGAPEGMAAASVNNTMRQIMADLKGGVPVIVNTKALMSALDDAKLSENTAIQTLGLTTIGDDAGGLFRVTKTNISTEVTADPGGGVHIPFDSDGTGASGGFIRVLSSLYGNVKWFGATGDGSTDDSLEHIRDLPVTIIRQEKRSAARSTCCSPTRWLAGGLWGKSLLR